MRDAAAAKARILVVLHDLSLGGTEQTAVRLANAWSDLGREVTLLCGDPRGPSASLIGPKVIRVVADPLAARGAGGLGRLARATGRRLSSHPADVLYVPGNHHWPIVPAVLRLARDRRPRIAVQISNPLRRSDRGVVRQALFDTRARRLLAGADAVVALTEAARREADVVLRRPVASHIPLAVLDDDAPPPRLRRDGPPVVLCVGRLVAQKGFDVALAAFARGAPPEARLVFAGEGPLRPRLARRAAALGIAARVDFLGYVADVRAQLDGASLLLVTSRFEGYAAVVVEALAAGRPVVSTATAPAAVDLVTGPERGIVVRSRDPAALATALAETLGRPAGDLRGLAAVTLDHRLTPVARAYLDLFDRL